MTGHKNTDLRNTLAKRIRELRTWPPFNTGASAHNWRRPTIPETLSEHYGSQTLEQLVREACNQLEYAEVSELIERYSSGIENASCGSSRVSVLGLLSVQAIAVLGPDDEPDTALVLTRKNPATDKQYAEGIEAAWQQYLVDSLVSDDTDSQYQHFLKLKAYYENKAPA